MSVRDEQCREIAKKLRYAANDDLGRLSLQRNLAAITKAEDGSWRGVMRRLADLIDAPERSTCHLMETDHEYEVSYRCSACKSVVWLDFKGNPRPDYCQKCGAKVVD